LRLRTRECGGDGLRRTICSQWLMDDKQWAPDVLAEGLFIEAVGWDLMRSAKMKCKLDKLTKQYVRDTVDSTDWVGPLALDGWQ